MNRYLASFLDFLFHVIPMDRNMFFFSSFNGLYNDNPKYISEDLHKRFPSKTIVWVINDRANLNDIPSYVKQVRSMSLEYLYYKNRSKILVDNFFGFLGGNHKPRLFWQFMLKKRNQLNYSTWHGTPLKKIGNDYLDKPRNHYSTSTAMVLNSDYIISILKKAKTDEIPVYKTGSPRNDLLFEKNNEKKVEIRKKLGLPQKKVVLFAPTYRSANKDIFGEGFSIYLSNADIAKCITSLNKRFGGEWIFVYRAHQKVLDVNIKFDNLYIFNGNSHDDMAEYLLITDFLITDYSGSLFDFTITERPCLLYIPDYEHYKNEGRGLYMDINELPYPSARNLEELQAEIEGYEIDKIHHKISVFNKKLGMCDDGMASPRIVDMMINSVKE